VRKPAIRPTRAIRASCRAGAASGHATAPQPSSVLNSRRFIANSVPGVLNASAGIFSARVQADGCPNWVKMRNPHCEQMFSALLPKSDVIRQRSSWATSITARAVGHPAEGKAPRPQHSHRVVFFELMLSIGVDRINRVMVPNGISAALYFEAILLQKAASHEGYQAALALVRYRATSFAISPKFLDRSATSASLPWNSSSSSGVSGSESFE
jgi:hypothetical protein